MKIIICGACGRMGKAVAELAAEHGVEIACGVDVSPAPARFPVYTDFMQISETADIVIDFSSTDRLCERLDYCVEKGVGIVLAATGYTPEEEELVKKYAVRIPVFKTGNLSVGVNLLQMLVKKAAQILGEDFDAEIIERHHNKKKDAPSGTALMLANSVNEGFGGGKEFIYGRQGMVGERKKSEIGLHAVRGGSIVGEHEVIFAGDDEIITLAHSARSRKIFASGALRAAAWLQKKPAGLYDMSDLLSELI